MNVSEYRYSDSTTVTDTLPSGLCPIGTVNYDAHTDAQCDPNGAQPNPAYTSVVENTDGTFTIVWDLGHIDPNGTADGDVPGGRPHRLPGRRHQHDSHSRLRHADQYARRPPAISRFAATRATPIASPGARPSRTTDPLTVDDVNATATATQTAPGPDDHQVRLRRMSQRATPLDCASATYLTVGSAGYPPTYQKGDDICFQIDVAFAPGVDFKNPTVSDFLPPNTTYVAGSATMTASNTAIGGDRDPAGCRRAAVDDGDARDGRQSLSDARTRCSRCSSP